MAGRVRGSFRHWGLPPNTGLPCGTISVVGKSRAGSRGGGKEQQWGLRARRGRTKASGSQGLEREGGRSLELVRIGMRTWEGSRGSSCCGSCIQEAPCVLEHLAHKLETPRTDHLVPFTAGCPGSGHQVRCGGKPDSLGLQ